jgi:hypothetical protein
LYESISKKKIKDATQIKQEIKDKKELRRLKLMGATDLKTKTILLNRERSAQ